MRKSRLPAAAALPAAIFLACGCWPFGGKGEPVAKLGPRTRTGLPNPVPTIVEPSGAARRDLEFGPAPPRTAEKYRIRTSDRLEIGVFGENDMTKEVKVGPDGRISYFLATEVMASGLTLAEIKVEIERRLQPYFKKPRVFASLVDSAGNFVSVTGIVKSPGIYSISNETRLVDVIAKARGIPLAAHGLGGIADVEVADLSQAFVLRGDKFLNVDFEILFGRKRAGARAIAINNVLLQPNDRIFIPSAVSMDNKIFVVGAVRAPRVIRYSKEISFLEALVTAGDVPQGAWERKSFIIRGRMNKPRIIPVNTRLVRTGGIADIRLEAGDVIFVPKTPLAKTAEVIRQIDVIFSGITNAERASNVRMFDR